MAFHLPIILALALSVVYFLSDRFFHHAEKYHQYFLSLGAGMIVTLIFVEVFPDLFLNGTQYLGNFIFVAMLGGFTAYHLVERYAYLSAHKYKERVKELGYLHVAGFSFDNILAGFVLVLIFSLGTSQNILLYLIFFPILLDTLAASISMRHLNDRFRLDKLSLGLLSISPLLGAVLATVLNLTKFQFYFALSVLTGILLYFIVRDEIPRGRQGKPLFFLIGILLILPLLLAGRLV